MRRVEPGGREIGCVLRRVLASVLLPGVVAGSAAAQDDATAFVPTTAHTTEARSTATQRPFAIGERLIYSVRVGKVGAAGTGVMTVSGPVDVRGTEVLLLTSEMKAGVGPINGAGRTESWLDVNRMTALRFVKQERRFLSRHRDSIEVFPESRRWMAADGTGGATPSGAPLDELSFIYFIRTLPLTADTVFELSRHFDATRNPVGLRILGHEFVSTRAGDFATVVVEMRVKDPRNYRGEGVIRIHLTDDACRLPVRIESTMPDVGRTVLTLESATRPDGRCLANERRTSR
jgi:hypothetical protein